MIFSKTLLIATLTVTSVAAQLSPFDHGQSQCPKGDMFCQISTGNDASYCKYWQTGPGGPVCQGSNTPCQCAGCRGDAYCHSKVGPSSYCKFWQKGAGKVCQYSNEPCDCKGDTPAPASPTTSCLQSNCPAQFGAMQTTDTGLSVLDCLNSSDGSTAAASKCVAPYPTDPEVLAMASCGGMNSCWHAATAMSLAAPAGPYTWDSCGTKLDRLKTSKVSVDGALHAGSKVTVTAFGATDLHAPLESGAWQVRVYEDGVAKDTHTEVGDLMQALKFDDPKNTTFTITVSFTLPAKQASGSFDANLVATDQSKADYMCLDVKYKYSAEEAMMMAAAPATPLCFHQEDTEDHKCFEACNADGAKFATKGITGEGKCPANYNTVDTTKTVLQCPDGVTNVRYCASTALNVTIATKGEAGAAPAVVMVGAIDEPVVTPVEDFSVYCMNDPSKHAPYYCHVPPLPTSCKTDKDCTTPWYSSFCMNDASKKAPYVCKLELPPTCKTDADCKR